jgi:hypothetical protein
MGWKRGKQRKEGRSEEEEETTKKRRRTRRMFLFASCKLFQQYKASGPR